MRRRCIAWATATRINVRVTQQPAFILHHYPYGETSALLEVFSLAHGRVGLIAKGARRAKSDLRAILCPFQPLSIGWSGKGDLATLTQAEIDAEMILLSGRALYCGFYINELMLRLIHRHDPHERLFDAYRSALQGLQIAADHEATLRLFEKRLLDNLGYGLVLDREGVHGAAIDPEAAYSYAIERGPLRAAANAQGAIAHGAVVRGATLRALAAERFDTPAQLNEAKALLRGVLAHYIGTQPLHSRRLFQRIHSPAEIAP